MNAKEEFIEATNGYLVLCAEVKITDCSFILSSRRARGTVEATLRLGYTSDEYESFLNKLDVVYDDGFGGQELEGTVWLDKDVWLTRGEYDGSEWWEMHERPEVPEHLKQSA